MESRKDEEIGQAAQLQRAWPFTEPIATRDVVSKLIKGSDDLRPLRDLCTPPDDSNASLAECLGKQLRTAKGVQVDGRTFENDGKKPPRWFIKDAA